MTIGIVGAILWFARSLWLHSFTIFYIPMKFFLVFLIIVLTSVKGFSQLYIGYLNGNTLFVDIDNDTARIESFSDHYWSFFVVSEEFLVSKKGAKDTLFSGKHYHILKKKKKYLLSYRSSNSKEVYKIKIKICPNDNRRQLRNEAYYGVKFSEIERLEDSLLAPGKELIYPSSFYPRINNTELPEHLFREWADKTTDSMRFQILNVHKPKIDLYARVGDSIGFVDTSIVFDLLAKADYVYGDNYSKLFLDKLTSAKPEYLIQYIDKNPANKEEVLNAILWHKQNKEIVKRVKKVNVSSLGKNEIVKQRGKRVRLDVAAVSFGILGAAVEVGLIVLVIALIF
jgi:hypothetical protein